MRMSSTIEDRGFAVLPGIFPLRECEILLDQIDRSALTRSKAGVRHAMKDAATAALACDERLLDIARQVLGDKALPFRATLFEKSRQANWLVVWHQDTALPLRERRDMPGWGPWSKKGGITYGHAPAEVLSQILALRVHLDDSNLDNGPLRMLPGTHRQGVLSDDEIQQLASTVDPVACVVDQGGVVVMRPLLVHASSKSQSDLPRRVLHIEYAACQKLDLGLELAIA